MEQRTTPLISCPHTGVTHYAKVYQADNYATGVMSTDESKLLTQMIQATCFESWPTWTHDSARIGLCTESCTSPNPSPQLSHDEHIHTLIWEAMPGLAITSFKECLYAEDAADNKTFCLFSISALQKLVHHMGNSSLQVASF